MKLSIYAYRDKQLGAYTQPLINNIDKKRAQVAFSRGVIGLSEQQKESMIHYDLYYLGDYDDESGSIKAVVPEYIFSLDSVLLDNSVIKKDE